MVCIFSMKFKHFPSCWYMVVQEKCPEKGRLTLSVPQYDAFGPVELACHVTLRKTRIKSLRWNYTGWSTQNSSLQLRALLTYRSVVATDVDWSVRFSVMWLGFYRTILQSEVRAHLSSPESVRPDEEEVCTPNS